MTELDTKARNIVMSQLVQLQHIIAKDREELIKDLMKDRERDREELIKDLMKDREELMKDLMKDREKDREELIDARNEFRTMAMLK